MIRFTGGDREKLVMATAAAMTFMSAAGTIQPPVELTEINAHINDQVFADKVLEIFDGWIAEGVVKSTAI